LYLVSHRPCIHYIWSPTVHRTWKCNYFSKYKLLNNFSHQRSEQSCDFYVQLSSVFPAEHRLKLIRLDFCLDRCEQRRLLDSASLPRR
ncbi:unnamed protein product, partial [Staurois parvus]